MSAPIECPYVGLQPFREAHQAYFFGRARDQRVIIANLLAAPLTVLYGASGVGKSSVLMAGVLPQLRRERPRTPVVMFRDWVGEDFRQRLANACLDAVWQGGAVTAPRPEPDLPFDELLARCAEAARDTILVVFDQFEEYFLYHPKSNDPDSFEAQFARAVNRDEINVGFLIALREDSLSRLDRFRERIPHLLSNRLRLKHLDAESAIEAIQGPLRVWNTTLAPGQPAMEIEPALIDALLDQIRIGRVSVARDGANTTFDPEEQRVEAPFLQLVLTRLWAVETEQKSKLLRRATFDRLNGAQAIVQGHLDSVMQRLDANGQAVCASFFDRLVTPSGGKVACAEQDLTRWAGALAPQVPAVLQTLSRERILRTAAAAAGQGEGTYYEIYHDVLAPAILDWRRGFVAKQQQTAALRRYREETRRRTQRRLQIGFTVLALIALAGWAKSFVDSKRAASNAIAARVGALALTDAPRALKLALDAVDVTQRWGLPVTPAAEDALRQAVRMAGQEPLTLALGDWVWDVAFSSDGQRLAVGSRNGAATLWSVAQVKAGVRRPLQTLQHESHVREVAFLDHGDRLLAVSGDTTRLWDALEPDRIRRFEQGSSIFHAFAVSADGRWLATAGRGEGSGQRLIKLWYLLSDDDQPRQVIDVEGAWIMGLAFSPDGCCLATVQVERGQVGRSFTEIWDPWQGVRLLSVPNRVPGDAVTFTPDGQRIVVAGRDNRVRVYRPAAGELPAILAHRGAGNELDEPIPWDVDVLAGHTDRIRDVTVSPDGTRIASASGDHSIRVWDAHTSAHLFTLRGHTSWVESVAFSPDGRLLASGGRDAGVKLWDISGHAGPLHGLAFSPDGALVATASADGRAKLWDVSGDRPRLTQTLCGHTGEVYRVAFDPSGMLVATASYDGTARLWERASGRPLRVFPKHADQLRDVAFSPDGWYLITAGADGVARIYDVDDLNGAPRAAILGDGVRAAQVQAVAFHPTEPRWMTAGSDGSLVLWNLARERLQAISQPGVKFVDVAFSPAGDRIAAIAKNRLYLWSSESFGPAATPVVAVSPEVTAHFSLAFSPDGRQIALAGMDGAVRLVDAANGNPLRIVRPHGEAVNQAEFSPDGTRIATAGADRTLAVAPLRFDALHALARRMNAPAEVLSNPDMSPKAGSE
ncbi:MAG: hypothetical protein ACFCUG_00150 [Thiotrichales bacterium]